MISEPRRRWLPFLVATFFASGCIRPAPGTWGTVAAVLVALPLFFLAPAQWWWLSFAIAACLATVLGLLSCPWSIRWYQRSDPSSVVIDEVAGMWLALALIFALPQAPTSGWMLYVSVAVAFAAFRVFDVAKPWPVYTLERLPGGWGIMFDDLAAGLYAALCVALMVMVFPV